MFSMPIKEMRAWLRRPGLKVILHVDYHKSKGAHTTLRITKAQAKKILQSAENHGTKFINAYVYPRINVIRIG